MNIDFCIVCIAYRKLAINAENIEFKLRFMFCHVGVVGKNFIAVS